MSEPVMSVLERLGITSKNLARIQTKLISPKQKQTESTFAFKWKKRDTYESKAVATATRKWLFEKYCAGNPRQLERWLDEGGKRKIILDAGCGSCFSSIIFFGDHLKKHDFLGVDISDSIRVARRRFRELGYRGEFLKADLGHIPIPNRSVDVIFSEGVLHHTDNTRQSLKVLSRKLKKGGLFLFYVYAQKAVIREFVDDYIRGFLKNKSHGEAWEALKPLTRLGIALGKLKKKIKVPEDIPYLGIKKGTLDIQRFFYWNVCKAYYHPKYNLDEMNHYNFDWYRPLNCHRHNRKEIVEFCQAADLKIIRMHEEPPGISVVARKK